jgi:predicted transcriptional regulator with HTH domain
MARQAAASKEALARATAKNFAPTGSLMPVKNEVEAPVATKESPREKVERQRRERIQEREKEWQQLQERKAASTVSVNPDNMYWPPYNFLAKEGEKEIHVRYTQDVIETTVLAPEEWQEFFDALDKTQNIGGAVKGTYDAFDTAKKLGGLGVTAYVKTHNGVDYLILKGYKQHMKTLLAGNRFKASNPQVVKFGLGALDSVKGMARYVKVTAPMEVLVGSAINVLQFVLNDEYTLKQLGVDQSKILMNILIASGLALGAAALFPVLASTAVYSGVTLVVSSFSVWVLDETTDFESKFINKVLESFE